MYSRELAFIHLDQGRGEAISTTLESRVNSLSLRQDYPFESTLPLVMTIAERHPPCHRHAGFNSRRQSRSVQKACRHTQTSGGARRSGDWVGGDSHSFQCPPLHVSAEVLPDALETPDHGELAVGEVLEEAIDQQARYLPPIAVTA